jgi:hypothetical protein
MHFKANASKSTDPFNAKDARGAKGTQTPIRTAMFSRRGSGARRTFWRCFAAGCGPAHRGRFALPDATTASRRCATWGQEFRTSDFLIPKENEMAHFGEKWGTRLDRIYRIFQDLQDWNPCFAALARRYNPSTAQGSRAATKSLDPFNAKVARGSKGTQAPIRTALFSRRGSGARRSFRWAGRRDASAFPSCGSSKFSTVPIPISIHFSQRTRRAQRRYGDSPGCFICVHLRHLRLKIRNFHGMENVFSIRRNRTEGVAEACPSLRSSRSWRETMAVHFSSHGAEPLMNMTARKTCQENKK